ncbi:hypothetical protein C8T65DRAFT_740557 [Cerioporus squamosus]|nr:hypothetical protein C8T65DRAFT_740557 [Cerioporus squamosus]
MEALLRVSDTIKSFRETRLSALRAPTEFFDFNRVSRPADLNTATHRISYNTRYFSGNYSLIIALLAVYALYAILFYSRHFTPLNALISQPH